MILVDDFTMRAYRTLPLKLFSVLNDGAYNECAIVDHRKFVIVFM